MKFRNMTANVLLWRVAKEVKFSLVRADDYSFAIDNMQTDSTILEEIIEISRLTAELLLHRFAGSNILEAVDGTLNLSAVVAKHPDIHQSGNSGAVRSFHDNFGISSFST